MMNKLKNRMGFTLAEVLLVVAILGVLSGVSAVSVTSYQRGMARFECDGIAKEIFVAAQNHLTVSKGQGYLGALESDYGTAEIKDGNKTGVYYYAVTRGNVDLNGGDKMFRLMLPFGSVDETVRVGGSYIVRYLPEAGMVLDVFYCQYSGKYKNSLSNLSGDEYKDLLTYSGDNNVSRRKQYGSNVLGWYGVDAQIATIMFNRVVAQLPVPLVEVRNEEKLYVKLIKLDGFDMNLDRIQIIVTGLTSGAREVFSLDSLNSYTAVLDDVTGTDKHFCEIDAGDVDFIPGENISIQAVAYREAAPTDDNYKKPSYSAPVMTNSLFADGSTETVAKIANIRHLENLDKVVSKLDEHDNKNKLNISSAVQVIGMSWTEFQKKIYGADTGYEGVNVVPPTPTSRIGSGYYPISPDYALSYDGQSNSISDVKTTGEANAGVFGSVSEVTAISNLELIDFNISGTTRAGALAGTLQNCNVENVLARNSTDAPETNISAPESGGLVGILSGGSVTKSAAAVIVNGSTFAGGLIGRASSNVTACYVTGCYSGGHTTNGSYEEWLKKPQHHYDVAGGTAGGLIGAQSLDVEVSCSYSTCSVSGSTAGGFVGSGAPGSSIVNCYSTGKVNEATAYAFIGTGSPTLTGNSYYSGVNVIKNENDFELLAPGVGVYDSSEITAFDLNAGTYNDFVGISFEHWDEARTYDETLVNYYSGKYNLKSVKRLDDSVADEDFVATHYGDWPSPEVFFINT